MFEKDGDIILSDVGYSVDERYWEVLYTDEQGRTLEVPVEWHGDSHVFVFAYGVKSWRDADASDEEKKRILTRIREALEFDGVAVEIDHAAYAETEDGTIIKFKDITNRGVNM